MESSTEFGEAENFFLSAPTLKDELVIQENVDKFIRKHCELRSQLVCVTSGGTSAPLERNCVRSLDNFSSGNRGAASTEYFLQAGYAVIFLHRRDSIQPYCRSILECFKPDYSSSIQGTAEALELIKRAVMLHHEAIVQGKLLKVSFTTVFDYLQSLRIIARSMNCLQKNAMFYLAAAVSDFYVPWEAMNEHKIQSQAGPIVIQPVSVPKMLKVLRMQWAPSAFCVSFKLETDLRILMQKANEALHKYDVHAVVANELITRDDKVIVLTNEGEKTIEKDNLNLDVEIMLVCFLRDQHREYLASKYIN